MAENWEWKIGARRFEAKNWEWKIWGRKFEAENWGGKSLQNFPPQFFSGKYFTRNFDIFLFFPRNQCR